METIAVDLDDVVCYEHEPTLQDDAAFCLTALSKTYNLEVVTARNPYRIEKTLSWISQSLPEIFSRTHFIRAYQGRIATKAEVCLEIGASYLVDDLPANCNPAAEAGVQPLLFGDYEWISYENLHPNICRVQGWLDVFDYFDKKSVDIQI